MSCPVHVVDAFTDRPFAGNPAAVCLLGDHREDGWMQRVAAEMNLSETAFLQPLAPGLWRLRWFTPAVEVDLCGHATLAAAHVLWNHHEAGEPVLRFETRGGELHAGRVGERIALDFPADPPRPVAMPDVLAEALGLEPLEVLQGRDDLMAVLQTAEQVRHLRPDLARLAEIPVRGVMVTAPSDQAGYDFVSRFFGPRAGIPEDPVTGSAHCVLGPYWGGRLQRERLCGYQASSRGGRVEVELGGERVRLLGQAVTTLEGVLHV